MAGRSMTSGSSELREALKYLHPGSLSPGAQVILQARMLMRARLARETLFEGTLAPVAPLALRVLVFCAFTQKVHSCRPFFSRCVCRARRLPADQPPPERGLSISQPLCSPRSPLIVRCFLQPASTIGSGFRPFGSKRSSLRGRRAQEPCFRAFPASASGQHFASKLSAPSPRNRTAR